MACFPWIKFQFFPLIYIDIETIFFSCVFHILSRFTLVKYFQIQLLATSIIEKVLRVCCLPFQNPFTASAQLFLSPNFFTCVPHESNQIFAYGQTFPCIICLKCCGFLTTRITFAGKMNVTCVFILQFSYLIFTTQRIFNIQSFHLFCIRICRDESFENILPILANEWAFL